jgi:thymidylate kinase
MIIAFSGIDGSGKTTQAQYVTHLLQSQGYSVRCVHITRWTWVYAIGQFLNGRRERDDSRGGVPLSHNLFGRSVRVLRRIVTLVDLLRFRWYAFYQTRVHRRILVCDRFFYDLGIQALYTNMMEPGFARWYWSLVPTPTVSVLLDVPPELAQRRENQHLLEYYQAKRGLYLEYAVLWGAVVIEAAKLEDAKQAVSRVLSKYFELDSE